MIEALLYLNSAILAFLALAAIYGSIRDEDRLFILAAFVFFAVAFMDAVAATVVVMQ